VRIAAVKVAVKIEGRQGTAQGGVLDKANW